MEEGDKIFVGRVVEMALSPIGAKVVSFGSVYPMKLRSKHGDNPWKEAVYKFSSMVVETSLGKKTLSLQRIGALPRWDVAWIGCRDFCYSDNLPPQYKDVCVERMYSAEVLALRESAKA